METLPFAKCHEDFHWSWHEETEKELTYICSKRGGIRTFGKNIYPCETNVTRSEHTLNDNAKTVRKNWYKFLIHIYVIKSPSS